MKKILSLLAFLSILMSGPTFASDQSKELSLSPVLIQMPEGSDGIGFDDINFSPTLKALIVPSGRTGKLNLIDPLTHRITSIEGFGAGKGKQGGDREGTTSADEGCGVIFASDRSDNTLHVVDPVSKKIVDFIALNGGPDYVRFVSAVNEVWVTEPHNQQIEVFSFSKTGAAPRLTHSLFISVPGGPESLVIDPTRQRAYTHLWSGITVAIDLKTHTIMARWSNGCEGSRGIALDEKKGFLFVGCKEGKAVVTDLAGGGKELSGLITDPGVDIISYNPALSHLYIPAADAATLSILGVSGTGKLSMLGKFKTAAHATCAAADDQDNIWVCDPDHGRLLLFKDPFPPSS